MVEKTLFERWLDEEVLPKGVAITAHMPNIPDWARQAALQASIKPLYYWGQDQASSKTDPAANVHPAHSATGPSSPSMRGGSPGADSVIKTPVFPSNLSGGPQDELANLVSRTPQLALITGPPGTQTLMPREHLGENWSEIHRVAKAAGYQYVPYDKFTGVSGHWKKVTQ